MVHPLSLYNWHQTDGVHVANLSSSQNMVSALSNGKIIGLYYT